MHRRTLLLGLASLGLAPAAFAARTRKTYRYAQTQGVKADLQSLDVFPAEPGQKQPIIAFIHGGGWTKGDKSGLGTASASAFTDQNMVYASLNYRLSPKYKHPAHVEDIAAGLAWLHANAASIGGDPDRMFIMGHSSGAQLAAIVAVDERRLGKHNLPLSTLKGAICLDGSGYDTVRYAKAVGMTNRGGDMFEDAFGKDEAVWADASPTLLAQPGKGICPFLIVSSTRPVARSQAANLAGAIQRAGSTADVMATDQEHIEIVSDIGKKNDKVTAAILFSLKAWGA